MTWMNFIENKQSLISLYKEKIPSLKNVSIHEIKMFEDGPDIEIDVDINEIPKVIPRKWLLNEFNKVQISIRFHMIDDFEMTGWGTINQVEISITKENDFYFLSIKGDRLILKCRSEIITIERINPYSV